MARTYLTNLDLSGNQLLNAIIQILATDPSSPSAGRLWYNSTGDGTLRYRNGAATVILGRLDQISPPTASLNLNGQRITSLGDPTAAQDAVTKSYADNIAASLSPKDSVRIASLANITVASGLVNGTVIDGVTLATGDRVLLKNQTAGAENGIYVVPASGAASRAGDANTATALRGMFTLVEEGTHAGELWILTTDPPITVGTTTLTFSKFGIGAASGTVNKFAQDIGDGTATSITVTHNLNTLDVVVSVHQKSGGAEVYPDVIKATANTVTLGFSLAPATASLRVIVMG